MSEWNSVDFAPQGWQCPICKVKLTRQELLGDDVLFEDFFDYCPHCGRKVKWE